MQKPSVTVVLPLLDKAQTCAYAVHLSDISVQFWLRTSRNLYFRIKVCNPVHRIEKSREILPGLWEAVKALQNNSRLKLNNQYFYNLLFTRANLRLVHITCHDKKEHSEATCDKRLFYLWYFSYRLLSYFLLFRSTMLSGCTSSIHLWVAPTFGRDLNEYGCFWHQRYSCDFIAKRKSWYFNWKKNEQIWIIYAWAELDWDQNEIDLTPCSLRQPSCVFILSSFRQTWNLSLELN